MFLCVVQMGKKASSPTYSVVCPWAMTAPGLLHPWCSVGHRQRASGWVSVPKARSFHAHWIGSGFTRFGHWWIFLFQAYFTQKVEIPPQKSTFYLAFLESVLIIVSGLMRLLCSFVSFAAQWEFQSSVSLVTCGLQIPAVWFHSPVNFLDHTQHKGLAVAVFGVLLCKLWGLIVSPNPLPFTTDTHNKREDDNQLFITFQCCFSCTSRLVPRKPQRFICVNIVGLF